MGEGMRRWKSNSSSNSKHYKLRPPSSPRNTIIANHGDRGSTRRDTSAAAPLVVGSQTLRVSVEGGLSSPTSDERRSFLRKACLLALFPDNGQQVHFRCSRGSLDRSTPRTRSGRLGRRLGQQVHQGAKPHVFRPIRCDEEDINNALHLYLRY